MLGGVFVVSMIRVFLLLSFLRTHRITPRIW
jgi:hypothetical protein